MRIRSLLMACLFACLATPLASARQPKSHPAGVHPKPNHPISKAKKFKKFKH